MTTARAVSTWRGPARCGASFRRFWDDDRSADAANRGRRTREIGIRELKHHASEAIARVAEGERAVVTRRGRPVAVILSLDESLEFMLGYADEFALARADALGRLDADE